MANTLPLTTYKRVQSQSDSLDGIACIAMVTGKPIADIFKVAVEKFGLPLWSPPSTLKAIVTAGPMP